MSSLPAVTDATFDDVVLGAPGAVLVDFWAEWCPPCRAMDPILVNFAEDHPEVRVVAVDADANPELVERFQALALPTYKVFRAGELVTTMVGARPKPAFEQALQPYLTP
ncbi:MAG: thioredoxin family protein [Pseudolysinimonas sp.]